MNQIRVEFYKLTRLLGFYFSAILLAGFGLNCGYSIFSDFNRTNITSVNEVFQTVVGDTSLMFIIMLIIAWFLGKDFSTRTIQNEIRIGYSRASVLLSRYVITFFAAILLHFIWIISNLIGFVMKCGMDFSIFNFTNFAWLIIVFMQIMAITSVVVMIEFFAKNALAAMVATAVTVFVTCNVIRNVIEMKVYQLTCFGLVQTGSWTILLPAMLYAIIVILVTGMITYMGFRNAEIK